MEKRTLGGSDFIHEGWDGGAGGDSDEEFSFRTGGVWDAYLSSKVSLSGLEFPGLEI